MEVKVVLMSKKKVFTVTEVAEVPIHMNEDETALAYLLNEGWRIEAASADGDLFFVLVREEGQ